MQFTALETSPPATRKDALLAVENLQVTFGDPRAAAALRGSRPSSTTPCSSLCKSPGQSCKPNPDQRPAAAAAGAGVRRPQFITAVPATAKAPPMSMDVSTLSPSHSAEQITPITGTRVI